MKIEYTYKELMDILDKNISILKNNSDVHNKERAILEKLALEKKEKDFVEIKQWIEEANVAERIKQCTVEEKGVVEGIFFNKTVTNRYTDRFKIKEILNEFSGCELSFYMNSDYNSFMFSREGSVLTVEVDNRYYSSMREVYVNETKVVSIGRVEDLTPDTLTSLFFHYDPNHLLDKTTCFKEKVQSLSKKSPHTKTFIMEEDDLHFIKTPSRTFLKSESEYRKEGSHFKEKQDED